MTSPEVQEHLDAIKKERLLRGAGWLFIAIILLVLTLFTWVASRDAEKANDRVDELESSSSTNRDRIDSLEQALQAQREQFRLCRKGLAKPGECNEPIVPPPDDVPDEPELQEYEIQEREVQEREVQEPEDQNPENQEGENQEGEVQDDETQDAEDQEGEEQESEIQEDEIQDDEKDDPDPNSLLNFQVADNCTPGPGAVIVDVNLLVEQNQQSVTYILTCETIAFP